MPNDKNFLPPQPEQTPQNQYQKIINELQTMAEEDQEIRKLAISYRKDLPENFDLENFQKEMETIDKNNLEKLKNIVEKIGWPSISKVGEKASHNAWLIIQHADNDVDFQEKCLSLMKNENHEKAALSDIAYLTDRIAVNKHQGQLYGTQFIKNANGKMEVQPIIDPENLDNRRKEMGMESFSEYEKTMQSLYD